MTEPTKLSLRDAAALTLARMGFSCETMTDRLIRFEFRLPNDLQALSIVCEFDPRQIMLIAATVINADQTDPYHIREAGDFLHRANYGFVPGNFELDYDTGQVRYRVSKCIDPDQEDPGLFLRTLSEVVSPYLVYGDALADVLLNGADPRDSAESSHEGLHSDSIFTILESIFQGFADVSDMDLSAADEEDAIRTLMEPYEGLEPYIMEGYLDVIRLFSSLFTEGTDPFIGEEADPLNTQIFPFDHSDQESESDEDEEHPDDDEDQTDDVSAFFA